MARLIDCDSFEAGIKILFGESNSIIHIIINKLHDQPTVEAIPKDQYENHLKADMVAMLTELQLEIEKLDSRAGYSGDGMPTFSTDYIRKKKVNELVQQKINKLKAEQER